MPHRSKSFPAPLPSRFTVRAAISALVCSLAVSAASAQIVVRNAVNPPYTPESLIKDVFLGDGVEILSVNFDGPASALGYFENGGGAVGLSKGLVLTTGEAQTNAGTFGADALSNENAQHDNASTVRDPNLEQIVPYLDPATGNPNILNVSRYTITFIPKGDRVSFRYAFASEEYPQFVCSEYNDVFGFFISGPGFTGPYQDGGVNIALVPGTTLPVTINSINGGVVGVSGSATYCTGAQGSLGNSAFYRDNSAAGQYPVYNGLTQILTAEASVTPCQTYTIQITIGDVRDAAYDSGVFLEAKSFSATKIDVNLATPSLGNELAEGCDPAIVTLGYNNIATVDRVIPFTISGTAVEGSDFSTLPRSVIVPAGQRSVSFSVQALTDALSEPTETLIFEVQTDPCTTRSLTINLVDRTIVPVPPLRDTTICAGFPVTLQAKLPLSVDTAKTFRNNILLPLIIHNVRNYRDVVVSGVAPNILNRNALARVCVDYSHSRPEDLDIFLFAPSGKTLELTTDNGGATAGAGVMCFTVDATTAIDDLANALPLNGDYSPEGDWSDILSSGDPINGTWRLQVTDDRNGGFGTVNRWWITFEPKYTLAYAWSPAAGLSCTDCPDPVATPGVTTTYTVQVTDSYGCLETGSVNVALISPTVVPVLACSPGFDRVDFSWAPDPQATRFEVSVDGGAFEDVGLLTSKAVVGLGLGQTVNIVVRAIGECQQTTGTGSCTTQNCPTIGLVASVTDATCAGYSDGTVTLTASGGLAPYRFIVGDDTLGVGTWTNLVAGSYNAVALDANGCKGLASFVIGEPPAMTLSVTHSGPTSCGGSAIAIATVSGGAGAPYSFDWSDGQSGAIASFSGSGTYYLTVRDGGGCAVRDSVEIQYPSPLRAAYSIREISCASAADGQLSIAPGGGSAPYLFSIGMGAQPDSVFRQLAAGVAYPVSISDALGCRLDTTITLTEPLALAIGFQVVDAACFGEANGRVRASVSNARGPLTYAWAGLSVSVDSLRGIVAGNYTLTATDSAGCVATATATVGQPNRLLATAAPDSVLCSGSSTGQIQLRTTGGVAPFQYAIAGSPLQTDSLFTALSVGSYRFEVLDANGCRTEVSAFVDEPLPLSAFHQLQVITCAGESNGGIDLTINGGTRPYTFAWIDGATTEDRTALGEGRYEVRVTDAKGCSYDYAVTLDAPLPLRLRSTQVDVSCFGYRDGSIRLQPTGGRQPYDYSWSGPNGYAFFGPAPGQLAAGTYDLRFSDTYGCSIDTAFVIEEPIAITLLTSIRDTVCSGASNGEGRVSVTGGTAPFAYSWSNGETDSVAVGLRAGLASVTVVDAQGCAFKDSAQVIALEPLRMTLQQTPVACYRDSNGRAEVASLAYGARAAGLNTFRYTWGAYPDSSRSQLRGLGGQQEAIVTATDARGCSVTDSIVVVEPAPLGIAPSVLQDVSCYAGTDGSASATVTGGNAPYTYRWSEGTSAGGGLAVNQALPAGRVTLRIIDSKGCTDSTTVVIREPDSLRISFVPTQVNCFAENSGSAIAAGSGGNVPYRYDWTHGPSGPRLDSLTAGTYVLALEDAKGCRQVDSVQIVRDVSVDIVTDVVNATCAGETDGSIEVVASGGQGPYLYRLSDEKPNRFGDFRFLAPGDYVVQARDRNGCPSPAVTVTVEEPQAFLVEAGGNYEIELGDSLRIDARVFNAIGEVTYLWLPRDSALFSCSSCRSTFVRPRVQGNVRVMAIDGRGCEAQDVIQLRIRKSARVLVPTGFTPDADGRDDLLLVHGKSGTLIKTFQIFNRWGELVHEAKDFPVNAARGGWNGAVRDKRVPAGVYIWKVEVEYLDGSTEVLTGQSTLIR